MTTIYRGDPDRTRGVYARGRMPDGRMTATLSCPSCGKAASLSQHAIDDVGVVTPSVVCPFDCGFHDFVQLNAWDMDRWP